MKLFPATAFINFVSIYLLGEFIRTSSCNIYLLVIACRFIKLAWAIPLKKIMTATVVRDFLNHGLLVYEPSEVVIFDNGTKLTFRFFTEVFRILGSNNIHTKMYNPECNGKDEIFNKTIAASFWLYVCDHPKQWDNFTDAITFEYKTQVHRTSNEDYFEIVIEKTPPYSQLDSKPEFLHTTTADVQLEVKSLEGSNDHRMKVDGRLKT